MSLRDEIRHTIQQNIQRYFLGLPDQPVTYFGKSVEIQRYGSTYSVTKTANLWYRTHFPEPRVMYPLDPHRSFTKAELCLCTWPTRNLL